MKFAMLLGWAIAVAPASKILPPSPSPIPSPSPSPGPRAGPVVAPTAANKGPSPTPSPTLPDSPKAPSPQAAAAAAADGELPRVGSIPGLVVDPPEPDPTPPPNAQGLAKGGVDARDLAMTSPDPAMRRYLAAVLAQQADVHSFVLLAQLASDGDVGVRQAVLNAVYTKRCKHEPGNLCTSLLASFTRDPEREVAWQARDWLLDRDLELALEDADKEYKLDLLAKLGGSPIIPPGPARHLLRCLSADSDDDIQDNAAWLLEQQP